MKNHGQAHRAHPRARWAHPQGTAVAAHWTIGVPWSTIRRGRAATKGELGGDGALPGGHRSVARGGPTIGSRPPKLPPLDPSERGRCTTGSNTRRSADAGSGRSTTRFATTTPATAWIWLPHCSKGREGCHRANTEEEEGRGHTATPGGRWYFLTTKESASVRNYHCSLHP
jgi:hypothetical protein